MPTLNVCVEIYMNKKKQNLFKLQIFLFFSEALYYIDKASEKKINICKLNKFCVFFLYIYIHTFIYMQYSYIYRFVKSKFSENLLVKIVQSTIKP